jgi:hypothetical protein
MIFDLAILQRPTTFCRTIATISVTKWYEVHTKVEIRIMVLLDEILN